MRNLVLQLGAEDSEELPDLDVVGTDTDIIMLELQERNHGYIE